MSFLGPRSGLLTIYRGPFTQKIAKNPQTSEASLDRILENGFQIRIQRIEIGRKPLRIGGLAEKY